MKSLSFLLAAITLVITSAVRAEPSPDVLKNPPRDSFLLIPLHVHILACDDQPDIKCKLTDADIDRIVGKINGVWHRAGIHFRLASLLHEEAANVPEFTKKKAAQTDQTESSLQLYRLLVPETSRKLTGFHAYYVHQLPPNGVYLGQNICFIKETASLRKVEGGIDEPLPRVTSHELGHGLGLPHRHNQTNLMASGTTGTLLNEAEVARARTQAHKINGTMTITQAQTALEAAKSKGDADSVRLLQRDLDAVGE